MHGEHLDENIRQAGFVDIKCRKVKIDLWELTHGSSPLEMFILTLDSKIGPAPVYNSFAGTVGPLMGCLAPVMPDEKARTRFAKQIVAEMTNSNHHLYTTGYEPLFRLLMPDMSWSEGNQIPQKVE